MPSAEAMMCNPLESDATSVQGRMPALLIVQLSPKLW
eukprot:CAMPEP_0184983710 /NCGR_PEP_ID=MMETSP1098-20130426/12842_1 /TAXON_ID=89044 /ORGANISM="Spumella elongata, Strain CCAP 955/1" /LENGTH=36 /DNA_ID= /DNA_START= /DNA_END= /DNA_ORIENTATION=